MKRKIIILPCNGKSAAGRITFLASQELVLEGKAEWYLKEGIFPNSSFSTRDVDKSFILVDGCEMKCLFNQSRKRGFTNNNHLSLNDIGIEIRQYDDFTREDIELAKDAIIAVCIEPDSFQQPKLPLVCNCK